MPQILVTGGLGFIGSHLLSLLLEAPDAEIVALDNLSTQAFPLQSLLPVIASGKRGELNLRIEPVAGFRTRVKFDYIYHLASIVGPARVITRAGYISETIVEDTYHVMRLAMDQGARLVNVSTSEIYGGGENGYCEESTPKIISGPASGRLEYAAAKLAAEVALENLCGNGKLDAVTIRPFNVAGVRQTGQGGFVLPRFVGQAILGRPLTVFGDGSQVRAFTDARDVARAIVLAAHSGERGVAYNVGNPANRITIDELADLVLEVVDSKSGKIHVDPTTIYGNGYRAAADKFPNSDRMLALGWRPQHDLMDTIAAVYRSMRALPPAELLSVAGLDTEEPRTPENSCDVGASGSSQIERYGIVHHCELHPKVRSLPQLIDIAQAARMDIRRVVYTEGSFDGMHVGHLRFLETARRQGDVLVVAIHSDAAVRRREGDSTPKVCQEQRIALLAALECVDFITLVDDSQPLQLISALKPDVFVVNDERASHLVHTEEELFVQSYGGRAVRIDSSDGRASSSPPMFFGITDDGARAHCVQQIG